MYVNGVENESDNDSEEAGVRLKMPTGMQYVFSMRSLTLSTVSPGNRSTARVAWDRVGGWVHKCLMRVQCVYKGLFTCTNVSGAR